MRTQYLQPFAQLMLLALSPQRVLFLHLGLFGIFSTTIALQKQSKAT
jgi:hypothetical protein